MLVLVFLIPFWGLISVAAKKTPAVLGTIAAVSLLGLWTDRYVFTMPSMVQEAPTLPLGWPERLVTAGFLGLWGLAYAAFARRFPIVSPRLMDELEAEEAGKKPDELLIDRQLQRALDLVTSISIFQAKGSASPNAGG